MNKKVLVVVLISVALMIIGGIVGFVGYMPMGGHKYLNPSYENSVVQAEDLVSATNNEMNPFDSIEATTDIGDITFVYGDSYGISLENFTKETLPFYSIDGSTLIVENPSNENQTNIPFSVNFGNTNPKIVITIPQGTELKKTEFIARDGDILFDTLNTQEFVAECSYGSMEVKGLTAKKASVKLADGDVSFTDTKVGTLTYSNDYGNSDFNNVEVESLTFSISDGELNFTGVTAGAVNGENDYGSINFTDSTLTKASFVLSDGNFKATNTKCVGLEINDDYGEVEFSGILEGKTKITTADGSVTLKLDGEEKNYAYELSNEDGNITVDNKTYQGSVIAKADVTNYLLVSTDYSDINLSFTK